MSEREIGEGARFELRLEIVRMKSSSLKNVVGRERKVSKEGGRDCRLEIAIACVHTERRVCFRRRNGTSRRRRSEIFSHLQNVNSIYFANPCINSDFVRKVTQFDLIGTLACIESRGLGTTAWREERGWILYCLSSVWRER